MTMRLKYLLPFLLLCVTVASCIKDEAPNAEADIETCVVPGNILIADPHIENDWIELLVAPNTDVSNLAPEFTLTPGATIDPPSGTARDFNLPQTYVVTSEDQKWHKTYTISCVINGKLSTKYSFESVRLKSGYYEFFEIGYDGAEQNIWASGNSGFKIVGIAKSPEEFPTFSTPNGKSGKGVKLVTKDTGEFGNDVGMPLAAGNLFIGNFVALSAVANPLKATRFGTPFNSVPTRLTGYYKYKAGSDFYNKNKELVPGREDSFDIYGILFETDSKTKYLDGGNSLTSPNLVAIARIEDSQKKETNQWTYFNLPFKMQEGKTIDRDKLANNQYSLSIVFTASIDGAYFEGALGSALEIDEVELMLEDEE